MVEHPSSALLRGEHEDRPSLPAEGGTAVGWSEGGPLLSTRRPRRADLAGRALRCGGPGARSVYPGFFAVLAQLRPWDGWLAPAGAFLVGQVAAAGGGQ